MTWQQVQAYGPVLLALVVVTATMVLWWRMPLRRATEADAPVDGTDEPAIIAATEPAGKEDPATPIARLQSNIDCCPTRRSADMAAAACEVGSHSASVGTSGSVRAPRRWCFPPRLASSMCSLTAVLS